MLSANTVPPQGGDMTPAVAETQQTLKLSRTKERNFLPQQETSTFLSFFSAWMNDNFLQLNSSKTEFLLIGTPHQLKSSPSTVLSFAGHIINPTTAVTNLGVRFDPTLSFDLHIQHICKTSFFHLRNISKLRPFLSLPVAEKLVHAFVSSRLDYCNALLIGISGRSLQRLQSIQNCAARILMRVPKRHHITPILHNLHWLPVRFRLEYKICLLTHQCVYGSAPVYLKELLSPHDPTRRLRSANINLLKVPKTKLCSMGDRAFQAAAPRLWNTLPVHLRAPQSVDSFKSRLKTFLFLKLSDAERLLHAWAVEQEGKSSLDLDYQCEYRP
ncbi:uncharacterized protein LOC115384260 [Salarias fasciatus]|uniref:uncharacterized protein LOC115384260 n=1 Tax=Salarias fasciatus TaxID=181472 RepID=UPI001176B1D9|nr:uncharacterized protein LOC115384260 [Salarias fasciatus]